MTVRRLWDVPAALSTSIDDAPLPPATREPPGASTGLVDSYMWEPDSGKHRYVLRHRFGATANRPLLLVMLNPAANHLPGFRRSTTCHAVRRWGQAHGYDSAVYVNLFSHIEPNSTFLGQVAPVQLNGPGADAAIERVADELHEGVAVAGWGNLPAGLNRQLYDERVTRIERLLGRPLLCLGFTRSGYPRHGRGWRPTDELVPLRPP